MCRYDIQSLYEIVEPLGQGSYGNVYSVIDKKGKKFAMKISNIINGMHISPIILREITNLKKFNHNNIVKLYDVIVGKFDKMDSICLILELCDCDLIGQKFNLDHFYQLIDSVIHIHEMGFYHGDLSFGNVMVKDNDIKVIDLGTMQRSYRDFDLELGPTYNVRPPECYNNDSIDGNKVDLWSLGCILYTMMTTMFVINPNVDESDVLEVLEKLCVRFDVSNNESKIVNALLKKNPTERYLENNLCDNNLGIINVIGFKKSNIFSTIEKNKMYELLILISDIIYYNNIGVETLFLTIHNAKRIKFTGKLEKLCQYNPSIAFLVLFWLSNKIISQTFLGVQDIDNMIQIIDVGKHCDIIGIHDSLCKSLKWNIDQEMCYNYMNYMENKYRDHFKYILLFLELTGFICDDNLVFSLAIYGILRKMVSAKSEKFNEVMEANKLENKMEKMYRRIVSHIYMILHSSGKKSEREFINVYFHNNELDGYCNFIEQITSLRDILN